MSADRLFDCLSKPDFLAMRGLANEVPIFVHAYEPQAEDAARQIAASLDGRLNASGIATRTIDLFELVLECLEADKRLQPILEREAALGKVKLLALLRGLTDPSSGAILAALRERLDATDAQLTLIVGVGRVFPFLRTHTVLEAIQPAMTRHPIVLFFPGRYLQTREGSQLQLFGTDVNPPLSRAYYRAINLADFCH